jgi:hypothetical protein
VIALVINVLACVLGGVVAASLHNLQNVSLFWSVVTGIVVYVASDLIAEHMFL